MAVHPGAVMTPGVSKFLGNRGRIFGPFWSFAMYMFFVPTRQGAMNSAYAAASPKVKAKANDYKSAYVDPIGVIVDPSPQAKDERLMDELYGTTLEILRELNV